MSTITREFCVVCGHDRDVRGERSAVHYEVRGEKVTLEVPVKVCESCGTVEDEGGLDLAELAFMEYRKRKGLLTPEQIRGIRKRYKLSQKSLAALLGMSEATINRYEGGGLQEQSHDQAIRACENLDVMRDLLRRRGDRLSDWQRKRIEGALEGEANSQHRLRPGGDRMGMPREVSLATGYRQFDYLRYVAVVIWLCRYLPLVTATSLNKLLFYVDFLHFKSEAVSLTGAAYRRLQHGPVPAAYGVLQQRMELEQYIDGREVKYRNGRTGIKFAIGTRAEGLDLSFSSRELKVLETVATVLGKLTPGEIRDRSHKESAWRQTEDRALISYDKATDLSLSVPD